MRRSRFVKAIEGAGNRDKASIKEALWFDIRTPESSEEESLALWRVAGFNHAPLLLGAAHLFIGLCSLILHPHEILTLSLVNPLFPLIAMLSLDAVAIAVLHHRDRLALAPHGIIRFLFGYLLLTALCWGWFGAGVTQQSHVGHEISVPLALGAGVIITAIVAVNSPPIAIASTIMGVIGALLFTQSLWVAAGILLMCTILVAYSIANARTIIAAGRKRLLLDAEARKAVRFVDEFENSGRGWFWETNAEGTLSYVSQQLADDFECEPQALLGRQFTDLLSVDSISMGEERKTLGFHLSARFPFSDVVVRAAVDKDIHWSLSGNPIFDERGRFLGFRGIGTDLTEQRRSEQEISRLARFDSLTGLPNRTMMRQTLEEALRNAASRRKGCALFLIDLDRFKNVNDTLGHPMGDALLRQVADRLKSVMGEHGQVGRLGGDEFKAVLPGTVDIGLLESLSRTLIEHVSRPYSVEGHRVTIGASVGIAIGDPGRACADSLIRNADLALYAAKAAGRGKHCFFDPSMHSEATDRQMLENDLRQAIERGELSVVYQPIVRAAGEEICGFEALVRWTHAVRGPISP
ncbi:MAG TPA: diguanylate cyclase, partial [Sphingomicrobium sp.]|nr:diguanylate cyclase [Sphingomicrobium sp.]